MADQYQYIKMPDGSYGKFDANASDDEIRGHVQKDFPDAFKGQTQQASPAPKSFLQNLQSNYASNVKPYTPEEQQQHGSVDTALHNFGRGAGEVLLGPIMHPLDTLRGLSGSLQSQPINPSNVEDMTLGRGVFQDVKQNGLQSIPHIAGQAAGALIGSKLPEMGAGAVEGASGLSDLIPSKARAGKAFEELNQKLANQPVNLNETLKPLQRATEIGARGGTLPKSISDLLTRSQAIEPMTFPEARDYQGSLSDLSSSDKMALSGRMSGGLKQINKGLFTDIQNAANTAGLGEDYANAMKQYRQAAQLRNAGRVAGKVAGGAALGAAGLSGAGKILGELTK